MLGAASNPLPSSARVPGSGTVVVKVSVPMGASDKSLTSNTFGLPVAVNCPRAASAAGEIVFMAAYTKQPEEPNDAEAWA